MNGESAKVDLTVVESWISRLKTIVNEYAADDIFNADETGLFFKCLPNKTLHPVGEKCLNGERSKERLSLLFCCSMTGEKLQPLVIGKSAKPRCFNGLNAVNFGSYYRNNQNAWITESYGTNGYLT